MTFTDRTRNPRGTISTWLAVTAWIAASVLGWTLFWVLLDWAPSRVWLVFPILVLIVDVTFTVAFGNFLSARQQRSRFTGIAAIATLVLGVWSFVIITVILLVTGHSVGATLSTIFFGTFVAAVSGLVGFFVLLALLWCGALAPPLFFRGSHGARSSSDTQRPDVRTRVR